MSSPPTMPRSKAARASHDHQEASAGAEIALENRLPAIYLVDSGGVFLPLQADVFADKEQFGRIFSIRPACQQRESPNCGRLGMCRPAAHTCRQCDENIIVKGTGTIYLAGRRARPGGDRRERHQRGVRRSRSSHPRFRRQRPFGGTRSRRLTCVAPPSPRWDADRRRYVASRSRATLSDRRPLRHHSSAILVRRGRFARSSRVSWMKPLA